MEPELGQHLGANIDTRPPEQAALQDVTAKETIAQSSAVDWQEIAQENIRTFGVQDQMGKSDCVAETRRKLKRVMLKVNKGIDIDFSSVAFYRKRVNYPEGGMQAYDAISLDVNGGMTLDALVPSEPVNTEALANALAPDKFNDDLAKVFATGGNDVVFTPGDIDTPAGTIQKTRKAVMMWFYGTTEEWAKLVPTIDVELSGTKDPRTKVVHSVAGIEPALYQGQQGVWIDDSAHFGGLHRRFVTRAFYKQRNFWASYPLAFKFEASAIAKPHYFFGKDLEFKAIFFTDADVVALQDILKYEGCMPTNVDSTGYFGALTLAAVKKYQIKHGIVTSGTPETTGFGRVGPKTLYSLNSEYWN